MRYGESMLRLMREIVSLQEPSGRDDYAEPTYAGSPTLRYRARIDRRPQQVRTATGEERVSSAAIRLAPVRVEPDDSLTGLAEAPTVTPEARLTLPDGKTPPILRVSEAEDRHGNRQTEIFV